MGEEMIATVIVWPMLMELNWEAGTRKVSELTVDEMVRGLEAAHGMPPEDEDEMRLEVTNIFDELRNTINDQTPRTGLTVFKVRGACVGFAGGMTFGDDPSDAFTAICDAYAFPMVMKAIGFDLEE